MKDRMQRIIDLGNKLHKADSSLDPEDLAQSLTLSLLIAIATDEQFSSALANVERMAQQ